MNSQILVEELKPSEANMIQETSSTNGKELFLQGIFMQSEVKNRNNRNYPLPLMEKVVADANIRIQEFGGIFGELDHPNSMTITSDRISHLITLLKLENKNVIGKAKMLNTPMGKIGRILVESGGKIGISSRGAGKVLEDGTVDIYNFVTADLVVTPSAPLAMPNAVYESIEELRTDKKVVSLAEEIRESIEYQTFLKDNLLKEITRLIVNTRK